MKNAISIVLLALTLSACAKAPIHFMGGSKNDVTLQNEQFENPTYSGLGESGVHEVEILGDPSVPKNTDGISRKVIAGMERLHFDFDQITLDDKDKEILINNASFLNNHPEVNIIIEGHCDARGSDEYNLALGEKRAQIVFGYLANLGIEKSRMRTVTFGEELPLSMGNTEEDYALNRRAEFKLP